VTGSRWLPIAAVTLFAAWFAWLNRGERIAVDVGVATFYRAPLTMVLFLAFLAGMLCMLLLSLRQDVRMREELRARGLLDAPSPSAQPVGAEWTRPREAPVEPLPAPAEDRTVVHPRYDGNAAAAPDPAAAEDRTIAYHRYDGDAGAEPSRAPAEDRTVVHPRYDGEPAD
jgi:uncharacterized integral membrane protein